MTAYHDNGAVVMLIKMKYREPGFTPAIVEHVATQLNDPAYIIVRCGYGYLMMVHENNLELIPTDKP
jgi:hypothetical protein